MTQVLSVLPLKRLPRMHVLTFALALLNDLNLVLVVLLVSKLR